MLSALCYRDEETEAEADVCLSGLLCLQSHTAGSQLESLQSPQNLSLSPLWPSTYVLLQATS